ncbi:MAG: RND transporter [Magnetococcales bacterium]|nr:RND transporter [Magnetococcales bacterium]HIJ83396.1 efflux RND transporter periplasmic adaptor subunit [Magnetococcales bacterium]
MKMIPLILLVGGIFLGMGTGHAFDAKPPQDRVLSAMEETGGGEPLRGLLVASQEAILSSEIAGRVLEIRHETRQSFKKGEILLRFHCPDREARLKKARAQLDAINQRLKVHRQLVELRSASLLDVEIMEAERLGATAEVAVHQAEVEQCTLYAPFAGRIAERLVKPYESVNMGQPLLDVVGQAPFEIHIILPSDLLPGVHPGTPVTIVLDETKSRHQARISSLGGRINPAGQTVRVVAKMAGVADDLIPGMSGPVMIEFDPLSSSAAPR